MRNLLAAVALTFLAAPLPAQREGGGAVPRIPTGAFPRSAFIDAGAVEHRPVPPHTGPIPFPPVNRPWLKIETPHFIVISALTERATRATAHDLEKLTA